MDIFRYIVRFLYKIRWYLAILPLIAMIVAWFATRNMERIYDAKTTIYTGMITGYNIEGGTGTAGGNQQTNITNLMLIIQTDNTIHEVALRLFARCMMYGNKNKDNNFITAEHFRQLDASVPAEVKALINHNSEQETYRNLKAYEKPTQDNFLFGLLNYHQYFGISEITSRLKVLQLEQSDIIDISYSANDPGVCYNTIDILNEVFARQYRDLRYGETLNVIKFFEKEVARLYKVLTEAENDLIKYNVKHRIINYGEQTKVLSGMEGQQQLKDNELRMNIATTEALIAYLKRQLGDRAKIIESNQNYTNLVRDITRLQSRIANLKLMSSENGGANNEAQVELAKAERQLNETTKKVKELSHSLEASNFSTDTGVKSTDLIDKWLEQVLLLEQTKAELGAQDIMKENINSQFLFFSPIGATLSRKDRHIGFIEAGPLASTQSSDVNGRSSHPQPTCIPFECTTHEPHDDTHWCIYANICHDGLVFLHYRIARPHLARSYAFRTDYQDTCHGLLPQGEHFALSPIQQDHQRHGIASTQQDTPSSFQGRPTKCA